MYRSFEDLDAWKRASRLAVRTYEVLHNCSDRSLKNQMTRAAVSVASNIAEGAERGSNPDFIRFLHIAKGSLAELRTQTYIAFKINILSEETRVELVGECVELSKMLHGLIKSLKKA